MVTVGLVLASLTLTACSDDDSEYTAVCVDPQTQLRVDDDQCDDDDDRGGHHPHFVYFPYSSGHSYPAVGQKITGGSTVRPAGASYTTVPKTGGFGTAGKVSSGS